MIAEAHIAVRSNKESISNSSNSSNRSNKSSNNSSSSSKKKESSLKKRLEAEKAVQIAIEKSEKKKQKESEKRHSQITECNRTWNIEILPNWSSLSKSKRVKDLCSKGIPPSIRGKVWPLLAGNEIVITDELFDNLIIIAELSAERQSINLDYRSTDVDNDNDNNNNDYLENNQNNDTLPYEDRSTRKTLIPNRTKTLVLIERDLPRTFPTLGFFHDGGDMQQSLERILQAYACLRPDVGYVQGMSYIAAVLLLYMDELDAFKCLVNILNRRNNMDFYLLKKEAIDNYVKCFDYFFEEQLPLLYSHMSAEGLTSEMYLMDWNLALFSKALPLEAAARIWDCYLFEGEVFIIRAALGILKMFANILGSHKLEEIMSLLMHLPEDINIDELLSNIAQIKVTEVRYEKIRAKIYGDEVEERENIFSFITEFFKGDNNNNKKTNNDDNNDNDNNNGNDINFTDSRNSERMSIRNSDRTSMRNSNRNSIKATKGGSRDCIIS